MISAKSISNVPEVCNDPELYYPNKPIVLTEVFDSNDENYHVVIKLEKQNESYIIVSYNGELKEEFVSEGLESLSDLYRRAFNGTRSSCQFSMSWHDEVPRRDDATILALCKHMNSVIDDRIKIVFTGSDNKVHNFSDDDKLRDVINDVVRQVYVPEFVEALRAAGWELNKKRK